ncbi:hypothetical protein GCM10023185_18210 [Hymenobacter saemangeumensis]|uniref:SusE outer membrane protein domain-containing protein n=1 Tax=Hymenobacter saemangeumensis TaxID=1084522 RepID=A0ABP8IBI6_9BACT
MYNKFAKLAVLGSLLFAFAACEKDETKATLNVVAKPALTASATTATIAQSTPNVPAVTYSWTAADFNFPAAVTYTLQFAKANTNFASTEDINVGSALSKSFTNKELNDLYNTIDCNLPSTPAPVRLDVRVKASLGGKVEPAYSEVKSMVASPYQAVTIPTQQWGLVGPAGNGWPGATPNDIMLTYDCTVRAYVLRNAQLNAGEFKFRQDQSWSTNLGGPAGDFRQGVPLTLNGPNLVAAAGRYTVKLVVNRDAAGAVTGGVVTLTP